MKNLIFIAALVVLDAPYHGAIAEGALPGATTGENGVNRRVLTPPSAFTGVKGTFKLPSLHLVPASKYKPGPTFYLGASQKNSSSNDLQVDAGFQWEPTALPNSNGQVNSYIPPGWKIFVRSTTPTTGPAGVEVNPTGSWRCGPGTANPNVSNVDMSWVFFRRSTSTYSPSVGPKFGGYLYVNVIGANAQPSGELGSNKLLAKTSSSSDALTDDLSAMRCKRVVGITQNSLGSLPLPNGGVYDEDNTTVTGLTFSQGQVTQANPLVGPFGPSYSPAGWTIWVDTNTDINPSKTIGGTGFFPGGKDLTLRRLVYFPSTSYFLEQILNQSAAGARDVFKFNSEPNREDPRPGRYSNEDVDVSLRRFVPTGGAIVNPGG